MSFWKRIFGADTESGAPAAKSKSETANELAGLKQTVLECFGERISPRQNPIRVNGIWCGFGNYPLALSHIPRSNGIPPEWFSGLWVLGTCPSCQKQRPAFHFPTFHYHDARDWKSFQGDHKKSPEYKAAYKLSLNAHTAQCRAQLASYVATSAANEAKFETYCPHCLAVGKL